MNALEIEPTICDLTLQAFDPVEFPYVILASFRHKDVALKKLRSGHSNTSDVGGVLLRNHEHIAVVTSE